MTGQPSFAVFQQLLYLGLADIIVLMLVKNGNENLEVVEEA